MAQMAMQETLVQSLGQEDPLEEEMATHFLPGKSHEQGGAWWATVHGVRHDWVTNIFTFILYIYICLYGFYYYLLWRINALEIYFKIISHSSLNYISNIKVRNQIPLLIIHFKIVTFTHAVALCSGKKTKNKKTYVSLSTITIRTRKLLSKSQMKVLWIMTHFM